MTTLPISRWLREMSGVRLPSASSLQPLLPGKTKEMTTMNLMMFGIVFAVAGASAEALTVVRHGTWHGQFLMGLIGGSVGLIVNMAVFRKDEELCPRKIARQTIASVFLAGGTAPAVSRGVAGWMQTESTDDLLIAVSTIIGLGGVYVLRQYGEKISDLAVKWGLSKSGIPSDEVK